MDKEFNKFFLDDPWMHMSEPNYPDGGSRLYKKSRDFWVSINNDEELIFFVRADGIFKIKKIPKLKNLKISLDHFDNETNVLIQNLQVGNDLSYLLFFPEDFD